VDRAACERVGVVGSIAARRQHGSECLLPRGNAAAVRCAPCVPAAVPGCVLHQGSFVRLLPAYPVSTQQPSLRHPASRAALPAGGRLEGPSELLWGAHAGVRQPSHGPERAPVLRVYSFRVSGSQRAFCRRAQGVTQASSRESRALSSFGVSLATVLTFTLDIRNSIVEIDIVVPSSVNA
jgi:hypothetical protein